MKKLLVTCLVGASLGAVPSADAAATLSYPKAKAGAERAARQLARQDSRIAEWELARAFRFTSRKWVFAWWAQLGDGRICTAQLVVRFNSSKTEKVIGYFRNQECG